MLYHLGVHPQSQSGCHGGGMCGDWWLLSWTFPPIRVPRPMPLRVCCHARPPFPVSALTRSSSRTQPHEHAGRGSPSSMLQSRICSCQIMQALASRLLFRFALQLLWIVPVHLGACLFRMLGCVLATQCTILQASTCALLRMVRIH